MLDRPSSTLDQVFYPPFVRPSRQPLRFPFNLAALLKNNLAAIPEDAYRQALTISPGPPRMAFVTGGELVQALLQTRAAEFRKGALQVDILKPIFGNAMISAEGHDWRWQRATAAPLFRHEELMQFGPCMSAAAEAVVAKWRAAETGTVHALHADMMRAAFQVISNTMLVGGADDMIEAIERGHADYYRGVNWWVIYTLLKLPHWLPRPGGKAMRAHEARLRNAVARIVAARRQDAAAGQDLLGRLARAKDPETGHAMPDELLVDNIVSFLVAGFDTTAFALTWTLYLISKSPEWEARMLAEVRRVAGGGPITAAHARELKVVQQVLNESLRLFPTAPLIIRDILEDVSVDGWTIPAGTIGVIPIYAIHRHRGYWHNPNRFDPSRFSLDGPPKSARFQFLPFGAGPRVCIGAAFAMMELTIMLATFVRAARFQLADGFQPQPAGQMFLLSQNGMPMKVTMRTGA